MRRDAVVGCPTRERTHWRQTSSRPTLAAVLFVLFSVLAPFTLIAVWCGAGVERLPILFVQIACRKTGRAVGCRSDPKPVVHGGCFGDSKCAIPEIAGWQVCGWASRSRSLLQGCVSVFCAPRWGSSGGLRQGCPAPPS
eukprot:scaffold20036_cov112-Isochrysis_galbana.AAC.4